MDGVGEGPLFDVLFISTDEEFGVERPFLRRRLDHIPIEGILYDGLGVSSLGGQGSILSLSTEAREEPRNRACGITVATIFSSGCLCIHLAAYLQ